jgi:hypothetical protein
MSKYTKTVGRFDEIKEMCRALERDAAEAATVMEAVNSGTQKKVFKGIAMLAKMLRLALVEIEEADKEPRP